MYIKEIYISDYKILHDLKIQLQPPSPSRNMVNVVAGINGTGKTSLLEGIAKRFAKLISSENIQLTLDAATEQKFCKNGELQIPKLVNSFDREGANSLPKVIYIASYLIDQFMPVTQLETEYQLVNQLEPEKILGNAEYYIREYILAHERNSYEADPKKRTCAAVENFNQYFQETNLLTQLYDLDNKHFNRPVFKQKGSEKLISIDCLSDGEKQLYGLIIALMILEPSDSIIGDEPELALHPAWQQVIMSLYAKIGQNNQFIVATHSPQIIARTPINHLILLRKNSISHKIEAIYPKQPPSGIDINSILAEFMGADFIPKEQVDLHREYRKWVEEHQENSLEAQKIKQQILERESNISEFMQEMQLMIQLRGECISALSRKMSPHQIA
jgi:predicted ATP-binding protein involved in virulence